MPLCGNIDYAAADALQLNDGHRAIAARGDECVARTVFGDGLIQTGVFEVGAGDARLVVRQRRFGVESDGSCGQHVEAAVADDGRVGDGRIDVHSHAGRTDVHKEQQEHWPCNICVYSSFLFTYTRGWPCIGRILVCTGKIPDMCVRL